MTMAGHDCFCLSGALLIVSEWAVRMGLGFDIICASANDALQHCLPGRPFGINDAKALENSLSITHHNQTHDNRRSRRPLA